MAKSYWKPLQPPPSTVMRRVTGAEACAEHMGGGLDLRLPTGETSAASSSSRAPGAHLRLQLPQPLHRAVGNGQALGAAAAGGGGIQRHGLCAGRPRVPLASLRRQLLLLQGTARLRWRDSCCALQRPVLPGPSVQPAVRSHAQPGLGSGQGGGEGLVVERRLRDGRSCSGLANSIAGHPAACRFCSGGCGLPRQGHSPA